MGRGTYILCFSTASTHRKCRWDLVFNTINFVYQLSHEFQNDLRVGFLGNQEILDEAQNWVETQPTPQSLLRK